jgi:hypothetical protein
MLLTPPILRNPLLALLERTYHTKPMKPLFGNIHLHDKTQAIVPVFDIKEMILSLLHAPSVMNEHNIFSVDETKDQCNTCYDEVHTGEAWHRAKNH